MFVVKYVKKIKKPSEPKEPMEKARPGETFSDVVLPDMPKKSQFSKQVDLKRPETTHAHPVSHKSLTTVPHPYLTNFEL